MNREEPRDKNYAAIKRDINASCMCSSRRDLTSESRSRGNKDLAREGRPRDHLSPGIKESLSNVRAKCRELPSELENTHRYTHSPNGRRP